MKFSFQKKKDGVSLRKKHFFDRDPSKLYFRPYRDWAFIVGFFAVLFLVSVWGNIYLFQKIDAGDIFTITIDEPGNVEVLNARRYTDVVARFEEKEREFARLKTQAPAIVDPAF